MKSYDAEARESHMPSVQHVRICYLECCLKLYSGNGSYHESVEIPGALVAQCSYGDLSLLNILIENGLEGYSMTTISISLPKCDPIPLWIMQYEGSFQSSEGIVIGKVIRLHNEALRTAYKEKVFWGGRGQAMFPTEGFDHNGLAYRNRLSPGSDFRKFSGDESIMNKAGKTLLSLNYSGKLLIPLKEGVERGYDETRMP